MNNYSKQTVQIEVIPSKVLLLRSQNREVLLRYVDFLKKEAEELNGILVQEKKYTNELMLVFRFTDFESCQTFTEFVKAK